MVLQTLFCFANTETFLDAINWSRTNATIFQRVRPNLSKYLFMLRIR